MTFNEFVDCVMFAMCSLLIGVAVVAVVAVVIVVFVAAFAWLTYKPSPLERLEESAPPPIYVGAIVDATEGKP